MKEKIRKKYSEDRRKEVKHNMSKDEIQQIACNVIANAGSAFDCFVQAVRAAIENKFDEADNLIKEGDCLLIKAHQVQTDLLNNEIQGEYIPVGILMVHAQDHYMHAMTYKQIALDLIALNKKIANISDKEEK